MPYPPNLNVTDHRSPEYAFFDEDEALGRIEEAKADLRNAVDDICAASSVWEDLTVTDPHQDYAAALAPRIADLATAFPVALDAGNNPVSFSIADDLLQMALRLMKLRATTRSAHFHADLRDQVRLVGGYISAIEKEEAR